MSGGMNEDYEALLQFLYQAPIRLVQATLDGDITLINSMSAQLLMPLHRWRLRTVVFVMRAVGMPLPQSWHSWCWWRGEDRFRSRPACNPLRVGGECAIRSHGQRDAGSRNVPGIRAHEG